MAETNRTVLVVDDEPSVCHALCGLLKDQGYTVLAAGSGERALQILREKPVQVLISDQYMPEMPGIDLLKLVRVRHPQVLRIMLTGSNDSETAVRSINEGEVYRFIRKPWKNSELRTLLQHAFVVARRAEEERQLISSAPKRRSGSGAGPADPLGLEPEVAFLAEAELES